METGTFTVMVCFIFTTAESADLAYRHQSVESPDMSLLVLTDHNINTCGNFQTDSMATPVSDFSLPILEYHDSGNYTVEVQGDNMGCAASDDAKLYVMLVAESDRQSVLGRRESCRLADVIPGDKDTCRYECYCSGECSAIRFVRRPMQQNFNSWTLCSVSPLIYIDPGCTHGIGGDGGAAGPNYAEHFRISQGSLTAFEFAMHSTGGIAGFRDRYGTEFRSWYGASSGTQHNVTLAPDETITSVTAYAGNLGNPYCFVGLKFVTNTSREIGPIGSTTAESIVATGTELMYLSGRSGGYVDSIRFHFRGC